MTREEAIKELRGFIGQLTEGCQEAINVLIPELAESEDERIRKDIISLVNEWWDRTGTSHPEFSTRGEMLAYLKKQKDSPMPEDTVIFQKGVAEGRRLEQKEQKPEWSVEDKRKLNRIYAILGQAADTHAFSNTCRLIGDKEAVELQDFLRSIAKPKSYDWSEEDERIVQTMIKEADLKPSEMHWLKSLKNRGNSPKSNTNSPSWGEEDEKMLVGIIERGSAQIPPFEPALRGEQMEWLMNRLKSLRPRWKPSEEQMRAFHELLGGKVPRAPELYELYNDLEKLM